MRLISFLFFFCLISPISWATEPPLIKVTATGKVLAQPDQAEFNISFSATKPESEHAHEIVNDQSNAFLNILEDFELESQSLDSSRVNIFPEYDYRNKQRTLVGYRVIRRVSFKLNQLKQLDELIKHISQTKTSSLEQIQFGVSDPGVLKEEALSNAIVSATRTAQNIAEGFDVKLSKIHRVQHREPTNQQPMMRAMSVQSEMSADTSNNYQQKDLEFKATIDVAFTFN
jgi:uncharacterized protein YggE